MTPTLALSGNCSPITTLPPEILLCIFKYAYVAARFRPRRKMICSKKTCAAEKGCFCYIQPNDKDDWERFMVQSPFRQFPTSVASVCTRWEDIMLHVPAFWTRILIHLDADVFSLQKLELKLRVSGDQPIEILVTRTSFSDAEGMKDIELSRMTKIITVLRSHVHRCRTLQIEVAYSSSLPRLLPFLPPNMPHIQKLVLKSCIDSGSPEVQPYSQAGHAHLIDWRELETIMIDGWNLTELCRCTPSPSHQIFPKGLSLSIKFGRDGFSSSFIQRLIEDYSLKDFEVDSVTFTTGDKPQQNPSINNFTLRNLNPEVTDIMLGFFHQAGELTIDNCPSTSITRLPATPVLNLKNISSKQSFRDLIRMWHGTDFLVTACSGFDDDILDLVTSMSRSLQDSHLTELDRLTITDCHNFTINALRELVETRTSNSMMLSRLTVRKCGSTPPRDDIRWFEKRVTSFLWQEDFAVSGSIMYLQSKK